MQTGNMDRCPCSVLLLLLSLSFSHGEVLTPPYFNLAESSTITATATCGVNITTSKERFCSLTGASADEQGAIFGGANSQIIAGQLCDDCFAETNPDASKTNVHPAKYAIDGTEKWWQSPPLSRGSQYNNVNLTIDLGQVSLRFCHHFPSLAWNWFAYASQPSDCHCWRLTFQPCHHVYHDSIIWPV